MTVQDLHYLRVSLKLLFHKNYSRSLYFSSPDFFRYIFPLFIKIHSAERTAMLRAAPDPRSLHAIYHLKV